MFPCSRQKSLDCWPMTWMLETKRNFLIIVSFRDCFSIKLFRLLLRSSPTMPSAIKRLSNVHFRLETLSGFDQLSPRVTMHISSVFLTSLTFGIIANCLSANDCSHLTLESSHKSTPECVHVPVQISVFYRLLTIKWYTQTFSAFLLSLVFAERSDNIKNVKIISTLEAIWTAISPTHTIQ